MALTQFPRYVAGTNEVTLTMLLLGATNKKIPKNATPDEILQKALYMDLRKLKIIDMVCR